MLSIYSPSRFRQNPWANEGGILWTSFFGVYFHIMLDSPLYDIKPFFPFEDNPFYGSFSSQQIYQF